jgi:ribosomal protein S18 acetylase RimI-like enzyme
MQIRYYHPEDDPALMQFERLSPRGLPEPFVHFRRRFIDRAALFPDHQMLVVDDGGVVVGCIAIAVKRTQVGGRPVSLGYIFDVRTHPNVRRRGIGTRMLQAAEDYMVDRGVDGAYGHIVTSNVGSLRLFGNLGYERTRQLILLTFQPYPMMEVPDFMPRHTGDYTVDHDLVEAVHSSRDMYVPDVADAVHDFGYERWSLDMGGSQFAGFSLFDQSYVFQQWPAAAPFPTEEELRTISNASLRLFNEVGAHSPTLLQAIFDTLRDNAVADSVSKLSLLLDRMDRVPTFLFAEASRQMDYWLAFKSLNPEWTPEWQDGPIYIDTREL